MFRNACDLVLASGSPRRRELISRLGVHFEVWPSEVDEKFGSGDPVEAEVVEWARRKAEAVAGRNPGWGGRWFLGVDTVVVVGGEILGKPRSRAEAGRFLALLAGRWHEVWSGYCLLHPDSGRMTRNAVRSEVKIVELSGEEIAAYLDTGEPFDKAGAYATQGIGAFMVEEIRGSYTNVVGLPLAELVRDLKRLGIIVPG